MELIKSFDTKEEAELFAKDFPKMAENAVMGELDEHPEGKEKIGESSPPIISDEEIENAELIVPENPEDELSKELVERVVWVHPRVGQPFQRRMMVDPEHMREIGKKGFAATSKKIADMIKDPNADPDDVAGLARWFAKRIKNTTTTYRTLWWRQFREQMKEGADNKMATVVANAFIGELTGYAEPQ